MFDFVQNDICQLRIGKMGALSLSYSHVWNGGHCARVCVCVCGSVEGVNVCVFLGHG